MRWIVVLALAAFCAQPAQAQTYPNKPIHLIVPYAPGGVADIAARLVGAKLTEALGQQVVVENRTGGNGFIAVTAVVKAPADGYTLLVPTVGEITINPALFKDIPYNVQRDLAPVGMLSDTPIVLAHPSGPWQDEALSIALHKPQVYIDLSGWSPKYFPPQLVQYANTQLKRKVLFGTDYPLITPERWLADFAKIDIRDEVRPLILKGNAIDLLKLGA